MGKQLIIADEKIINRIYFIRDHKVMIDRDLAILYSVSTGRINERVKRNKRRFPNDFMFQLTPIEFEILKFQFGTSRWGGTRKMPYAFTEQGVAMLSSVLNSKTALDVNIQIIRVFTKMREMLSTHKDVLIKLAQLEKKILKQEVRTNAHAEEIRKLFEAINQLMIPIHKPRKRVGYKRQNEE